MTRADRRTGSAGGARLAQVLRWLALASGIRRAASPAVRRFGRDRSGAGAVEFAILAAPFLALLCVTAEAGVVALSQQTLDMALDRAARQLRTGAFQDAADGTDPSQRLQQVMCGGAVVLFPCATLRIDVSYALAFSAAQAMDPFDKQAKTWAKGFGTRFDCPQGDTVVTVRAAVPVLRLFKFLDFTGRIMSDQTQLLISTMIFRSEPYPQKSCS